MVWIYTEETEERWRISHKEIYSDIETKLGADTNLAVSFIDTMLKVCNGEEPEDLTEELEAFNSLPGFSAEMILKVYKWIWAQEDCNYPPPNKKGRWMSMDAIIELRDIQLKS